MNIGAINSGVGLSLINAYNKASLNAARQAEKLAAGTSMVRASDNPSMVGTVESLKSQINANKVIATNADPAAIELRAVSSVIESLKGRTELAQSSGTEDALRDLVTAMRQAGETRSANGVKLLAGDENQKEEIVINHEATAAKVTGASTSATITFNADSVTNEGGTDVEKATLTLGSAEQSWDIKVDVGVMTREDALSSIENAINSQAPDSGIMVSLDGDKFVFTSGSTGSSSQLSVNGGAAASISAAGDGVGTDAYEERLEGPNKALDVSYAGRAVTFLNINAAADELEKLLDAGDLSGALSSTASTLGALKALGSTVNFSANQLTNDKNVKLAQNEVLTEQLDNITGLDVAATTTEMLKEQVRMDQAAWAMSVYRETVLGNIKTLLGED